MPTAPSPERGMQSGFSARKAWFSWAAAPWPLWGDGARLNGTAGLVNAIRSFRINPAVQNPAEGSDKTGTNFTATISTLVERI